MRVAGNSILPGTGRGTVRRTVEGLALSQNVGHDRPKVGQDFSSRNAHRPITLSHKPLVASFIVDRVRSTTMCLTVNLDRQLGLEARKIQDVGPCRMLTSKSEAAGSLAKLAQEWGE